MGTKDAPVGCIDCWLSPALDTVLVWTLTKRVDISHRSSWSGALLKSGDDVACKPQVVKYWAKILAIVRLPVNQDKISKVTGF